MLSFNLSERGTHGYHGAPKDYELSLQDGSKQGSPTAILILSIDIKPRRNSRLLVVHLPTQVAAQST